MSSAQIFRQTERLLDQAAADAMAYKLRVPSREGLIRNRYSGRTFIEGKHQRVRKAESKYTPLREVLEGKKVILVEDSIVRSTTMKVLLGRMRSLGLAREIHVRIACPPIIADPVPAAAWAAPGVA